MAARRAATIRLYNSSYSEAELDFTAESRIEVKWCRWLAVFPTRSASATVVLTAVAPDTNTSQENLIGFSRCFPRLEAVTTAPYLRAQWKRASEKMSWRPNRIPIRSRACLRLAQARPRTSCFV